MRYERIIDNTWNYTDSDTKGLTHCYHSYPAMMIPQVARRLINEFATKKTRLIFDPYCGSGTSLVEAKIAGINSVGTDINPLAGLISKAKTLNLSVKRIDDLRKLLIVRLERYKGTEKVKISEMSNLEFWFSNSITHKLGFLKKIIFEIENEDERFFFLVPFSETVREASYTRNSEFKLYRIQKEKLKDFNVDPFLLFNKKVERNLKGLKAFNKAIGRKKNNAEIFDFNTCIEIPKEILQENSVDLIVTSPPYGDSHTTVAYGQFSTLSNEWMGIKEARKIDNKLMGGKKKETHIELDVLSAIPELNEIRKIDEERFFEVYSFLHDYYDSIKNISKVVKHKGYACYVVGNRTVKKTNIPFDQITAELFEHFGFDFKSIRVRKIPNKKMPSKNSPSNKVGDLVTTMNNEFIVVMQKQ